MGAAKDGKDARRDPLRRRLGSQMRRLEGGVLQTAIRSAFECNEFVTDSRDIRRLIHLRVLP